MVCVLYHSTTANTESKTGIYCILFILAVYILLTRQRAGYVWHLGSTIILFVLSTIHVVLNIVVGSLGGQPVYAFSVDGTDSPLISDTRPGGAYGKFAMSIMAVFVLSK